MRRVRCAIYTRKSSEEGLEQDFNSLDAQREACEAYIASQKHEGWELLPDHYDDGGISGGHLDRPALQRLMQAMDEKRVDQIVVYKIDRLTRSLADFAKLVDRLDAAETSFVSVIRHKKQVYEGQHPAIIDPAVWDKVQKMLQSGAAVARGSRHKATRSLLVGKLFDETGDRLTPSHSRKNGKRLRYYISRRLVKDRSRKHPDAWRLPADQVEGLLAELVGQHLTRPGAAVAMTEGLTAAELNDVSKRLQEQGNVTDRLALIERADLRPGSLAVKLDTEKLANRLDCLPEQINLAELTVEAPFQMRRRGVEMKLHLGEAPAEIDRTLVQNIMKGRSWLAMVIAGKTFSEIAGIEGVSKRRVQDVTNLALLAPDVLDRIVAGEQPDGLTTDYLIKTRFPAVWSEQREQFASL